MKRRTGTRGATIPWPEPEPVIALFGGGADSRDVEVGAVAQVLRLPSGSVVVGVGDGPAARAAMATAKLWADEYVPVRVADEGDVVLLPGVRVLRFSAAKGAAA